MYPGQGNSEPRFPSFASIYHLLLCLRATNIHREEMALGYAYELQLDSAEDGVEDCDFLTAYHMKHVVDNYELPPHCLSLRHYTRSNYWFVNDMISASKRYLPLVKEAVKIQYDCEASARSEGIRMVMRGGVCSQINDYLRDKILDIASCMESPGNEYIFDTETLENDFFKFKAALLTSDIAYYLSGLFLIDALV